VLKEVHSIGKQNHRRSVIFLSITNEVLALLGEKVYLSSDGYKKETAGKGSPSEDCPNGHWKCNYVTWISRLYD